MVFLRNRDDGYLKGLLGVKARNSDGSSRGCLRAISPARSCCGDQRFELRAFARIHRHELAMVKEKAVSRLKAGGCELVHVTYAALGGDQEGGDRHGVEGGLRKEIGCLAVHDFRAEPEGSLDMGKEGFEKMDGIRVHWPLLLAAPEGEEASLFRGAAGHQGHVFEIVRAQNLIVEFGPEEVGATDQLLGMNNADPGICHGRGRVRVVGPVVLIVQVQSFRVEIEPSACESHVSLIRMDGDHIAAGGVGQSAEVV